MPVVAEPLHLCWGQGNDHAAQEVREEQRLAQPDLERAFVDAFASSMSSSMKDVIVCCSAMLCQAKVKSSALSGSPSPSARPRGGGKRYPTVARDAHVVGHGRHDVEFGVDHQKAAIEVLAEVEAFERARPRARGRRTEARRSPDALGRLEASVLLHTAQNASSYMSSAFSKSKATW